MVSGKKRGKHLTDLFHNPNGSGYYSFYWVQHHSGSYEVNAFKKSFQYWKSLLGANRLSIWNASFLSLSYYCQFLMWNIKWDHVCIKSAIGQKHCLSAVRHTCTTAYVLWVRVKRITRTISCLENFSGFFLAFFVCFRLAFFLNPVSGFCDAGCFSLCLQHLHCYHFSLKSIALSSPPASTDTILRKNISHPQKRKGGEKGLQSSSLSFSPCHSCTYTEKDYMGQICISIRREWITT